MENTNSISYKIKKGMLEKKLITRCFKILGKAICTVFSPLAKLRNIIASKGDTYFYNKAIKKLQTSGPIVNNRIVIATNTFNYTCNPKYIYEELMKRDEDLEIYWMVKDLKAAKKSYPEGTNFTVLGTVDCLEKVYSAKVWLNNGIVFSNYFDKRPGQYYLQTMHGSLGIKKLDNAVTARNNRGENGQKVVSREENNTDIVFTNSKFEEDVFKSVFWHDTKMERLGHARTDVLFDEETSEKYKEIRETLRTKYDIPLDHKLVLYAPTHRSFLTEQELDVDYPRLCMELSNKFGGSWTVLLRLHDRSFKLLKSVFSSLDSGMAYDPEWEDVTVTSAATFEDKTVLAGGEYDYRVIPAYTAGEFDEDHAYSAVHAKQDKENFVVWSPRENAVEYKLERRLCCSVKNLSKYPDMQELMLVADVGITDYSSWIYDYVNTKKPGFIYAVDLDRYTFATGFYYPLTATPFPVCEDNDDLADAIRAMDMDAYEAECQAFLDDKQAIDDGHSAERIADRIIELIHQ